MLWRALPRWLKVWYLNFYMHLIFKNVTLVQSSAAGEIYEQLAHIGKGDVLVGICFPRYSKMAIHAVEYASRKGGDVVAITDSALSPLYQMASVSLVLFSLIPVGFAANAMGGAGGPLSVYFVAIVAAECGKLVSKETKIDILVTPIVTVLVGILVADVVAAPIGAAAAAVGTFVRWATVLQPFWMGILVSVVIGVALTLPISSAAICAALSLTGLAGGAAVAGCCAQMVGFAVMSFKENRWGGLVAQGVGTSMLQMPNIVKNPKIWIPPTLASAITGPLATCLFKLEMNGAAVSSGMGTCGFVGQIGVYTGWVNDIASGAKAAITGMDWVGMVLICFVLPAVLSWVFCEVLRKKGWIKENDLKLDL